MGTLAQYLVLPIVWIFSKLFSNSVEFIGEDNFSEAVRRPTIIVANHISAYDSFLLRLSKYWVKMRVYFMGVKKFNSWQLTFLAKIGIISLVYNFFGVFVVTPGIGLEKNLEVSKKILKQKGNIFIFPEGSINRTDSLLPFKRGAAALAIATQTPILPIAFRVIPAQKGKKTIITIGKPIIFPKDMDYQLATDELQSIIKKLRVSS